MKRKVLVTGASGMLGRSLMEHVSRTQDVIGTSRSGRFDTVACDLNERTQTEQLISKTAPSILIHSAAYSDVDGCEKDPLLARQINAFGTRYLAEACASRKITFVYVSTDYVFSGTKQKDLYLETDQTFPVNIYGLTKFEGEQYTIAAGGRSAIVRTSWLFGGPNPTNFVNAMIQRLKTEERVMVLDDQEDSPTHVKDLSAALLNIALSLAEAKDAASGVIYHFCNKGATTRFEMTQKMRDYMNLKEVRVDIQERRMIQGRVAVRPPRNVLSTARYEKTFGVQIRPWTDALREYIRESCAS